MVITILEANVAQDQVQTLEQAFREGSASLPQGLIESFLVHITQDESRYRIITVWSSQEALENMRASMEKPKGVQMFEAAGATPKLSIMDVDSHAQRQDK